jgi:hypothetical protein
VKRSANRVFVVAVGVAACTLVCIPVANAYVDPGTGSFIFQAVIGGALAAAVAIKVFWRRITGVFSRKDESPPAAE